MGAEGREPSGEDRRWKIGTRWRGSWKLGVVRWKRKGASPPVKLGIPQDRDALTRWGKFYTTAKRLYNEAQGRFGAPWVHSHHAFPTAKRLHNEAAFHCVQRYHAHSLQNLVEVWLWASVPDPGCAKATLGFVVHRLRRNQTHAQPFAPARQLVRASRFRSPISDLRASSFQLRNPRVLALWSTVIHHRFRLLPHRRCRCSLLPNVRLGCRTKRLAALRARARTLQSCSYSASAVLVLVIEGLARPKLLPSPPIFVDQRPFVFLAI